MDPAVLTAGELLENVREGRHESGRCGETRLAAQAAAAVGEAYPEVDNESRLMRELIAPREAGGFTLTRTGLAVPLSGGVLQRFDEAVARKIGNETALQVDDFLGAVRPDDSALQAGAGLE